MQQFKWWQIAIVIFAAILTLRVVGFIPNTWLLLGFIVYVLLWSFVLHLASGQTKLINWVFGALMAMALLSTVGYNLYLSQITAYTPASSEAAKRARLNADIETALRLYPHMLVSRAAINANMQELQDKVGKQNVKVLGIIQRQLDAGVINPAQAAREIEKVLDEEKKWAVESERLTQKLMTGKTAVAGQKEKSPAGSWPLRMMMLGFALMTVTLLVSKKVTDFTGKGLAVFAGLVLFLGGAIFFTFPEVQAKVESGSSISQKSTPTAEYYRHEPASFSTYLPANAVLLRKIPPGAEYYTVRYGRHDSPPPELWIKNLATGEVRKQGAWPAGSQGWDLRNPTQNSIEVYAVLPPNQNVSVDDPKQLVRATAAPNGQQHLLPNN